MGCQWNETPLPCQGNPGDDTGGDDGDDDDDGADDGGDGLDETGSPATQCDDCDPDSYVTCDRTNDEYDVDEVLVDDVVATPSLLWECDSTRAWIVSGGYYTLKDVGRDDLATQLGLQENDIVTSVNGYDLQWPDDYVTAYSALYNETEFTLEVDRGGTVLTFEYEVR